VTLAELRTDVVILTCAISAGIHGALVGDHFDEGAGPGIAFVLATVLLAALAVALTRRPTQLVLAGAALVFAGLLASYALAVTTGLPVLHPEREAVDGLALFTKAIEAIGLVTAASLLRRPSLVVALFEAKGTPT
jgi:CHASE2 domain-containing sensor protein